MVKNPTTMLSMARHALGMRIAVPLDALRWFIANTPPSKKAPQDVTISPRPPAIGIGATVDLMGTTVRAGASIRVDRIEVSDTQFKVTLRLSDVTMKVLGESFTPVAGLIKSGALDLSKPGNLAKYMPLPPTVVEARDNRIVIDLMKDPKIAGNPMVQRILPLITPVVTAYGLETDDDHLEVMFRPLPDGLRPAASAIRRHLVRPGIKRIRGLLPG